MIKALDPTLQIYALSPGFSANIPGTFWIDRLNVVGEIVPDKEANISIAVAMAPRKLSA